MCKGRVQLRKMRFFNKWCWNNWASARQETKPNQTNPDLTPYTQINSRWTIGLNVKSTTSKLLEKNIKNVCDFELSKDFLYLIPKMKIDQLSLTNSKSSLSLKDTAMQWEASHSPADNLSSHTSDKGLIPRTHKYLSKLNRKKTNSWKWAKHLKRRLTKKDIQMANKDMKTCSTVLVMGCGQYYSKCWGGPRATLIVYQECETLSTVAYEVKHGCHTSSHSPKWKEHLCSPKTLNANASRGFICNSQTWKQARCHSAGAWGVSQQRPRWNTTQPWNERNTNGHMCMSLKCVVRVKETWLKSLHGISVIWKRENDRNRTQVGNC